MSRVLRQKHVKNEMWNDDFELPKENQIIVRVINPTGNNLHKVESSDSDEVFLVSMPSKFRKNVWVKRGDYLLVEPIEEGDKVKAEIVKILSPEHIKEYTKANVWPRKFTRKRDLEQDGDDDDDEMEFQNPNRPHQYLEDESSSSDSE